MVRMKVNNTCKRIRTSLYAAISRRFGPEADWLQNHIANCPRCQRRLVSCGKVNLALSFMKAEPHRLDLLMRANAQAIRVLKHGLRDKPKAQKLKAKLPEPKLLERCGTYGHSAVNVAACIAILLLMKVGVFSSMDQVRTRGQKAYQQYYAKQAGEDLASEIFS
ncbi:MAG: hypothetical protein PVJ86_01670 [Phycisphaerales bacterium]